MTLREAAQQALEALKDWKEYMPGFWDDVDEKAITALRAALAEPERTVACIRSLTDQCAALIQERDNLQKQVWLYEKHGVTCQTYKHTVDSSCSECNVHHQYPPQHTA